MLGGAVLAAVVVMVVAIVISQGGEDEDTATTPAGSGGGSQPAAEQAQVEDLFQGIPQKGIVLGDPGAPATMIEFVDLQCPFCAQYSTEALPSVIEDFVRPGRLKLELRLLTFLGPDSERGAQAAAAAALQNRIWQYSEQFFRNQGPENSGYATDAFLQRLARDTPGLDTKRLGEDYGTPGAQRIVGQAAAQGEQLDVQGTPSFFIARGNGQPQPLEVQSLDAGTVTSALGDALGEG